MRAFYQRVNARRGFQKAVVATARKMTVLAWHLATRDEDYAFGRPGLIKLQWSVAHCPPGVTAWPRMSSRWCLRLHRLAPL